MDLEAINKEYADLKSRLNGYSKQIENYEKMIETLNLRKTVCMGEIAKAQLKHNASKIQSEQAKMDSYNKNIQDIKNNVEDAKKELAEIKEKIDARINEIRENPDMKKHIDEVMQKKYTRKINALNTEKKEKEEFKSKILNLQEIIKKHSTIGNYLNGIATANEIKKNAEEELAQNRGTLPTARITQLQNNILNAENKLKQNKGQLMTFLGKSAPNITEKDIDNLISSGLKKDSRGNVDLNSNVKRLDRQIKGINKNISNHTIAMQKYNIQIEPREEQVEETRKNKPKGIFSRLAEKIKNFFKRNSKKELTSGQEESEQDEAKDQAGEEQKSKEDAFRDSLKYEIVQDIVKEEKQGRLREAKQARKSQQDHDHEDR